MTLEEAMKHSGYVECASVRLSKWHRIAPSHNSSDIAKAVEISFDGDLEKFIKWADFYLAEGCGSPG